jgi:hypothetical protein
MWWWSRIGWRGHCAIPLSVPAETTADSHIWRWLSPPPAHTRTSDDRTVQTLKEAFIARTQHSLNKQACKREKGEQKHVPFSLLESCIGSGFGLGAALVAAAAAPAGAGAEAGAGVREVAVAAGAEEGAAEADARAGDDGLEPAGAVELEAACGVAAEEEVVLEVLDSAEVARTGFTIGVGGSEAIGVACCGVRASAGARMGRGGAGKLAAEGEAREVNGTGDARTVTVGAGFGAADSAEEGVEGAAEAGAGLG